MSNRNDYWAYVSLQNGGLIHHGVKGMKWRIRKDQDQENQNTRKNFNNRKTRKRGTSVRGTSELWALGKTIVEAMLGGDEGAF